MANFFPKWTNQLPWKLAICVLVLGAAITGGITYYFTPKYTRVGYQPTQPVPFPHDIHVEQLGMDCRHCHSFVEVASHSNVPTVENCMSCHQQIVAQSPKLDAVRAAWNSGKADGPPVNWLKIHVVPEFAYFNHAVHVNRGVSCYSCHGPVNEMKVVYQHESQSMKWCLDCHRAPENYLRPPDEVFNMNWKAGSANEQREIGMRFKDQWDVNPPVTCGGCHR
jgi:formate-dependent nitrite reductase cytochrome c552 subunit